ncbi:hypothetical protein SCP_0400530 [Sparassis crispa]|uniref:AB hydrolase-1 domain-containing protein n=1 Tax=Sparassis crispa TaxID=139825 RepID=A0A401GHN4_9APHY|nr:hypothetical protein SCP_0400530 [Sparassis crispa]GBE81682.1 hypothetical protein SCP_0400530 [Sparassis crispa]
MPVAPVDDHGTVLYYEDSGTPPASSNYTTIVLLHGACFYGPIFRPLLPFAASNNLRLVLVNLRDYPGSTPFSPAELRAIRENPSDAIQARGFELAAFLSWFVEREKIPPISESSDALHVRIGGLAVLGWSAGNYQTLSILAHAEKLPEVTRTLLNAYLRCVIFYDGSSSCIGEPLSKGMYNPLADPNLSDAQKWERAPTWLSSYYTKLELDLASETSAFTSALIARVPLHEAVVAGSADSRWTPTVQRMSVDELKSVFYGEVLRRSQMPIVNIDARIYKENFDRALFGFPSNSSEVRSAEDLVWPNVSIQVLWCDMSMSSGPYAVHHIVRLRESTKGGRTVGIHRLEDANHFAHWDYPERFVRFLAGLI